MPWHIMLSFTIIGVHLGYRGAAIKCSAISTECLKGERRCYGKRLLPKNFLPKSAYIYLSNKLWCRLQKKKKIRLTTLFSMLMESLAPFISTMIWRNIHHSRKVGLSCWAEQNGNPRQFLPLREEKIADPVNPFRARYLWLSQENVAWC